MGSRSDAICFQACNPKRRRTAARERYEAYKVATTVGEALELGATPVDIKHDLTHRFALPHHPRAKPPHQTHTNEAVGASLHTASQHQAHGNEAVEASLHTASRHQARGNEAVEASLHAASLDLSTEQATGGEDLLVLYDEGVANNNCLSGVEQIGTGSLACGSSEPAQESAEVQRQAVQIQALQKQLGAERAAVLRWEGDLEVWMAKAVSLDGEVAELRRNQRPPAERQHDMSKLQVVELALKACDRIGDRVEARQLGGVRPWVIWMAEHPPRDLLVQYAPRVWAALLLHAAWCMVYGEGFPFTRCLARIVEYTRHGRRLDLASPQASVLLAMQLLDLSAADCREAAALHCKLLMLLGKSGPRGMPEGPCN